MAGRTYRYYQDTPLYPFGYGLSYSTFTYSNLELSASDIETGQDIEVKVTVKNNGPYDGEEVSPINICVVFLFFYSSQHKGGLSMMKMLFAIVKAEIFNIIIIVSC